MNKKGYTCNMWLCYMLSFINLPPELTTMYIHEATLQYLKISYLAFLTWYRCHNTCNENKLPCICKVVYFHGKHYDTYNMCQVSNFHGYQVGTNITHYWLGWPFWNICVTNGHRYKISLRISYLASRKHKLPQMIIHEATLQYLKISYLAFLTWYRCHNTCNENKLPWIVKVHILHYIT
jgi:hypothetical protein